MYSVFLRPFVLEWCSIIGSTTIGETAEERHHGIHQRSKLLSTTAYGVQPQGAGTGSRGDDVLQRDDLWYIFWVEISPMRVPWDWYGIFTYMKGWFLMVNVGTYTSPMDPVGYEFCQKGFIFWKVSLFPIFGADKFWAQKNRFQGWTWTPPFAEVMKSSFCPK